MSVVINCEKGGEPHDKSVEPLHEFLANALAFHVYLDCVNWAVYEKT